MNKRIIGDPVELVFVFLIVLGIIMAIVSYVNYRRESQLGRGALAVFGLLFGLGNSITGIVGLTTGAAVNDFGNPIWLGYANFFWTLASVPWFLFTLQYTGRYTRTTWKLIAVLYAPFSTFVFTFIHGFFEARGAGIASAFGSLVYIYCLALIFIGAFLLVQATHSYVHLSARQGISLAAVPVLVALVGNTGHSLQATSVLLATGTYTLAFAVGTFLFGVALLSDSLLERTPAVERKGREAITRETDDLVWIVDEGDTLVEYNTAVTETLRTEASAGKPIAETLKYDTDDLKSQETITLETTTGKRRYDPQVSPITVHHGTEIGSVLSLRDVTERELREERLTVLNRVLRHNLQNKMDVVKSHAEVLNDRYKDDHIKSIISAVDSITDLGSSARSVDRFISSTAEGEQVDLVEHLETLLDNVEPDTMVSITTDLPASASVRTNREALTGALESALDNALTYAHSTVEVSLEKNDNGYIVVVDDDGSGIPERELELLDVGTETKLQHGTGLGLWQLRWAVTTMGGDLCFDTDNGTTVRFTVPDQTSNHV